MAEALQPAPSPEIPAGRSCLNCGETLVGKYCSRCGQKDVDLHPTVRELASDLVGEIFSLDTRLLRTVVPLVFRPGALTRDYLAGRRVRFVSPLKVYLIAALLFFGLLALLPKTNVTVERGQTRRFGMTEGGGTRVSFSLPERFPVFDRQLQAASARAKANPQAYTDAVIANAPRVFFLLLPAFALFLALFYRGEWHYLDHLVFALHYHAFVFLNLTTLTVLGRPWVPSMVAWVLFPLLVISLFAYLPVALRRVYGGSRTMTFFKLFGLGSLYLVVFWAGVMLVVFGTLWLF
jgi:hypothetical protein